MLSGYFTLTGSASLPTFQRSGYLINETKGAYGVEADLQRHFFDIPSRDKSVSLFGDYNQKLATLDSSFGDLPYREKLASIGMGSTPGIVVNDTEHGSLAVLGSIPAYGLYDTSTGSAFYLFTDNPGRLSLVLEAQPLRYLVYRFPTAPVVFIQAAGVCSKWWRWVTTSNSVLHAFNALEHKLYGLPKA